MWFRYTVDLWFDIQAMRIFLQEHQVWFFTLNLSGVFLGLLWTAYEFYNVITTPGAKITNTEIFFAGLTLPLLGQHVTYLAILSLFRGSLHPFLFVSTLAEAILESSISSFIQTYAVVFTSNLTWDQKAQLYFSVFSSFVSIGYAFSTIDMKQGGRMLVKVPGFCNGFNARFTVVFLFRICEITSRATSLALFQTVTRPYGMFIIIAADGIIMSMVTIFYQCRVGQFAPVERLTFVRWDLSDGHIEFELRDCVDCLDLEPRPKLLLCYPLCTFLPHGAALLHGGCKSWSSFQRLRSEECFFEAYTGEGHCDHHPTNHLLHHQAKPVLLEATASIPKELSFGQVLRARWHGRSGWGVDGVGQGLCKGTV